jgi:membrane protease YdiL (CAAX protease family)
MTAIVYPQKAQTKSYQPMKLFESLLLFGVPAAILAASIWMLWPAMMEAGMSRAWSYTISLSLVNAGLVVAAVTGYRLEGNPWNWQVFSKRMRLSRMTGKTWLWTIGGTLLFGGLALLINSGAAAIYKAVGFSMPDQSPGSMSVWMNILVLFFNIVGEELWWRGYILPRQELTHGKWTWLIHGILWAWFHMFKWWAVPFMMITCLIIPFVAQKTRNTWAGMINHIIINGAGVLMAAM